MLCMDIDAVDIDRILTELCGQFGSSLPEGVAGGRTALRNALARRLRCSPHEADALVDTLVLRSSIKLVFQPDGSPVWQIATQHCH